MLPPESLPSKVASLSVTLRWRLRFERIMVKMRLAQVFAEGLGVD